MQHFRPNLKILQAPAPKLKRLFTLHLTCRNGLTLWLYMRPSSICHNRHTPVVQRDVSSGQRGQQFEEQLPPPRQLNLHFRRRFLFTLSFSS
jgi:hypothetical protein